mgnify:CR=1 FL=1
MSLADQHCQACEGGVEPMDSETAERHLAELNGEAPAQQTPWAITADGRTLKKGYKLKDFDQAVAMVNRIRDLAEAENHHPDLDVGYGRVVVRLSTHAIGGLSLNDFILAAQIDARGAP